MNVTSILESILFVASKPLDISKIAKAMETSEGEVEHALELISQKYSASSGIHLLRSGDEVQLVSNPEYAPYVEKFTKSEVMGELTKPQLETLTVVAYRGPITRPELEEIRGVNCSVILRNLMIRGLVIETDQTDSVMPVYELSIDALRHVGIASVQDLPEYDSLHAHAHLNAENGEQE